MPKVARFVYLFVGVVLALGGTLFAQPMAQADSGERYAAPSAVGNGNYFDATPTTTFDILWLEGGNCTMPPSNAVTALNYAAGLWGTWIASAVPISVTVCWTANPSGGDALGTGMPSKYVYNFSSAPLVNTYYPIALANALSGSDLYSGADITLQFDSDVPWSYATATIGESAPTESYDFIAVALHELAHGLGFVGNMVEEYNVGFCGNSMSSLYCPTPYDWFAVDSAGIPLLNYLTPDPRQLAARLKSDAKSGGPNTVAANGGAAARLHTPDAWQLGSSLSHLDYTTYQPTANRLMTPSYSGVTRHPGPVTLAILQDMGWRRTDGVPNVVTTGPLIVGAGQAAALTGNLVWSGYTGQPITYTWKATEHTIVTHPGKADADNATFTWISPGEKQITLTATDGVTTAHATRNLLVYNVTAGGPTQGDLNKSYTFTAAISPSIASFPITYTWEATDKTPVVHANIYQTTDSTAFTWTSPGTKTITITAAIAGAVTRDVHEVMIEGVVLDKHVFLPLVLRP